MQIKEISLLFRMAPLEGAKLLTNLFSPYYVWIDGLISSNQG